MQPNGLLNLKVTASQEDMRNRITLRITWQEEEKVTSKRPLTVD